MQQEVVCNEWMVQREVVYNEWIDAAGSGVQ